LLRVEDIDPPREVAGSADRIIQDLSRLGMRPDATVLYQSARLDAYRSACASLLSSGKAYWCGCSRKDLPASGVYPGTCRNGIPTGKKPRAVRVRVDDASVQFQDKLQGNKVESLGRDSGDFVILRADGLFAYQLAVVIDDAFQGITQIVRGADLLDSTARQIWLQKCLALPTPEYAHIPVALASDGKKLSKRDRSDPIRLASPSEVVRQALQFLGQDAPERDLEGTWAWALEHWSLDRVPRLREKCFQPEKA